MIFTTLNTQRTKKKNRYPVYIGIIRLATMVKYRSQHYVTNTKEVDIRNPFAQRKTMRGYWEEA